MDLALNDYLIKEISVIVLEYIKAVSLDKPQLESKKLQIKNSSTEDKIFIFDKFFYLYHKNCIEEYDIKYQLINKYSISKLHTLLEIIKYKEKTYYLYIDSK